MGIILGILTVVLVIISLFLILVVLMQKAKSDGGMGAAMGGGMAEATFGADTDNVLSKATINSSIAFFILGLILFLGRVYQHTHVSNSGGALPSIAAPLPTVPLSLPVTPAPGVKAPTTAAPTPAPSATQTAPATPAPTSGADKK